MLLLGPQHSQPLTPCGGGQRSKLIVKSHNRIFAVHIHRIVRSNCGVSLSSVAVVLVVVGVVVVFAKRGSPVRDNLDPSLTQDYDWKSIGVPPPFSQSTTNNC